MAKNERLNEEAARDPNLPPTAARPVDISFLNQLNDEETQLPKKRDHHRSNRTKGDQNG